MSKGNIMVPQQFGNKTSLKWFSTRYVYVADSQTEGAGEGLWVKADIRVGLHI